MTKFLKWIMIKIPVSAWMLMLVVMFLLHPASIIFIGLTSLMVMVPWILLAKWVCKRCEESERFNGKI